MQAAQAPGLREKQAASAARVLLELGQNALEAGARTLVVYVARRAGGWRVGVLDDGPGFPPAVLAGRPGFTTTGRPGAGKGLALVRAAGRLQLRNTACGALALARLRARAKAEGLPDAAVALAQYAGGPAVAVVLAGPKGAAWLEMPVRPTAKKALAAQAAMERAVARTGLAGGRRRRKMRRILTVAKEQGL